MIGRTVTSWHGILQHVSANWTLIEGGDPALAILFSVFDLLDLFLIVIEFGLSPLLALLPVFTLSVGEVARSVVLHAYIQWATFLLRRALVASDGVKVEVLDGSDADTVRLPEVIRIATDVVKCLADAGALEYVFETRAVSVRSIPSLRG
jgi:hypothetical protein